VFLLPRLAGAGMKALAFSRRAPAEPDAVQESLTQESVQLLRPGQETVGARSLVSCGPLEFAHTLIEKHHTVERAIAFSTSSVLTKSGSEDSKEKALIASIQVSEQRLRSLCEKRDIALTLLRPTLIYGCGLDRNISLMAKFGRRFGFIPLAADAEGLRQPVHADDLAALAVRCLLSATGVRLESTACGGSTLSYREMMEKTAAVCGVGVRTAGLNTRLLSTAARLVSVLPGFRGINSAMVRRQSRDMVFDDSILRKTLNYQPRLFAPVAGDFEIPGFALDFQLRR
jgi:nucleoside-diphosphate-sugar epimerase